MNQSKSVYAFFGIIISAITAFMAYLFFSYVQVAHFEPVNVEVPQQPSTPVVPNSPADSPVIPPVIDEAGALSVRWQNPLPMIVDGDWVQKQDYGSGEMEAGVLHFYDVGVVTAGAYQNANVLVAEFESFGPQFVMPTFRFLKVGPQLTLLAQHSDDYSYLLDTSAMVVDDSLRLPGFGLPETFLEAQSGHTLKLDTAARHWFEMTALKPAFVQPGVGQMYAFDYDTTLDLFDIPFTNRLHGYLARLPDGRVAPYAVVYPFMGEDGIPNMVFSDGTRNATPYSIAEFASCGSTEYASVVWPRDAQQLKLVQVAVTNDGVSMYKSVDDSETKLQELYELYWVPEGEVRISFEEFVKQYPILYFRDNFGRLIRMSNTTFYPAAECGKPVIYLYPEQTQDVSVRVSPQNGFSYTDPEYNGGWNVVAHPDGRLINHADGKTYPYLFWEGNGGIMQSDFERGFVVQKSEVEAFLRKSLADLGFIDQEIADFIEFWLPRMQRSPYYFITFYGRETMDALAPLVVEPKPDTVIRVLMDYRELDEPMEVEEYPLFAPKRNGFTVAEWGGVLR